MLTTPLLALLCAVPVLGEAGESCRSDADCEASLSCVASTCTARRLPPVPTVAPAPVVAPTVEAPAVDTTSVEENPAPAGHFSGVHFLLGAMGGAGPMWSSALMWLHDTQIPFSATGMLAQGELRIGVLLGRLELAAELAPGSTGSFVEGVVGQHGSGAISAGWMLPLYERDGFSVSLPVRVRGGLRDEDGRWGAGRRKCGNRAAIRWRRARSAPPRCRRSPSILGQRVLDALQPQLHVDLLTSTPGERSCLRTSFPCSQFSS